MFSLGPRSVRLRTQIVLLQVAVVGVTVGLAFGVFAYIGNQRLSGEYGERALAIARTVASEPDVRAEVEHYADFSLQPGPRLRSDLADGPLQRIAADARLRTSALFVVITDDAGLRLAHPERARLGEMVSTDPSKALAGGEVVIREHGTLGESVRAKVPVLQPGTGRVVGEVSVGISTAAVREQLLRDLRRSGLLIAGALCAGIAGSVLLARRWHGLTLGLEPAELAELVREQDAVLHGIGEGVVAADTAWRVTVINDEARRLLGIEAAPGRDIDDLGLTPRVLEAFRAADGRLVQAAVGERIVVVTARSVLRDGRPLGAVLSVRDRTDVESLTRQLDAVRSLSAVLRAQRHEFANRLHLLNGLLHTGRPDEASHLLAELLGSGPLGAVLPGIDAVTDPYLQAFLAAKAAHAREQGVRLRLGPNTWVHANLAAPVDVTTVLGNLLDNAIEAARLGAAEHVAAGGANPTIAASVEPVAPGNAEPAAHRDAEPAAHRDAEPAARRDAEPAVGGDAEPARGGFESATGGDAAPAVVELELVQEGETLHIAVADSGGGVAAELVDSVFAEGVSTRAGEGVPGGRGVGLALSRQVARARGGDVLLGDPGGAADRDLAPEKALRGAEFIARLPGVLTEGEPAWALES
ncbi:sensor histidine kinase [Nocardia sp. NBC_01327]|uniref:sensor histidine kinase n=1 Tax=Nocardia sp. NBC_01327 TaxID=2903593 RepID=UPI002E0D2DEA|nr:Spo0B domain-containing protein [Nocardia sp. NBC_01327]